jgi:hypothetical protein
MDALGVLREWTQDCLRNTSVRDVVNSTMTGPTLGWERGRLKRLEQREKKLK